MWVLLILATQRCVARPVSVIGDLIVLLSRGLLLTHLLKQLLKLCTRMGSSDFGIEANGKTSATLQSSQIPGPLLVVIDLAVVGCPSSKGWDRRCRATHYTGCGEIDW